MSGQRWRLLIAEDEDLARERLTRLIGERTDLELVAICHNGHEAAAALDAGGIDIALLDIEMPGSNGMELLRRTETASSRPLVIFATAHSQFAVDAFAGEAVDYLLKPFDAERLDQALRVAIERLQARGAVAANERVRTVLAQDSFDASSSADSSKSGRLLVRESGRLLVLHDDQIDWIEAAGRHCVVHCAGKKFRVAGPLRVLIAALRRERFMAVSRAALVNLERVVELQEMFKGELIAVLRNGAEVRVSRRFRTQLLARLGATLT